MGADIITEIVEKPGEHADETETSLAMSLVPDWVKLDLADDGATRKSTIEAINKGWLSITRPWHIATSNTGVGDPSKSTAAKGEKILEALGKRLGKALHDVATTPDSDLFPYA
jgi:creatinine amidohydrolase